MKILSLPLIIILTSILFSCAEDKNTDTTENSIEAIPTVDLANHLAMDSGEVRMFTMPTPLQISTTLKLMTIEYKNELLLPHYSGVKTDIKMAMNLGAYVVDLGYTTVYNNFQEGINYAQDVQYLMEQLNISHYVNNGFVERFKNNSSNQDSLCNIILSSYAEAHSYFSQDEGLGLLILTGAYVEGLYFATQAMDNKKWKKEHDNILIQQKLFLDNFILLLNAYSENTNIKGIVTDLKSLKTSFDEVKIYSDPEKNGDYVLEKSISTGVKSNIKTETAKLRNKLLKAS